MLGFLCDFLKSEHDFLKQVEKNAFSAPRGAENL